MNDDMINTLIGKLEGAGLYALEKSTEFVKVGGIAGMLAAGFVAAMACIALAVLLLRKMPDKGTYGYGKSVVFRITAAAVGSFVLVCSVIAGLEQLTYFLAPEGALVMRAID